MFRQVPVKISKSKLSKNSCTFLNDLLIFKNLLQRIPLPPYLKRLAKREEIENRKVEKEMNARLRTATSSAEQEEIMTELNRQKTMIAKKHQTQKENYSKNLQERLRSRKQNAVANEIKQQKAMATAELENLERQQLDMATTTKLQTQTNVEMSQKVEINLDDYDTTNPLALLTELPVLKSIQNYEEKLRSQLSNLGGKSGQVLGSFDAPFLDIFDAQIGNSRQKLSVLDKPPEELQVVFEMGSELLDEMCLRLEVPIAKLLIARIRNSDRIAIVA